MVTTIDRPKVLATPSLPRDIHLPWCKCNSQFTNPLYSIRLPTHHLAQLILPTQISWKHHIPQRQGWSQSRSSRDTGWWPHPTHACAPTRTSAPGVRDGSNSILKMPLIGTLSVYWCNKPSFHHKGDLRFVSNSQRRNMWFLLPTLQATCNNRAKALCPQLTVVVVNHQQLAS
jgi:hypothetical protein